MDLKGSLIDTNIRIYPSEKFIEFIQNVTSENIPENFSKFIKGKNNLDDKISNDKLQLIIPITSADINILNRIKKDMNVSEDESNEIEQDKSIDATSTSEETVSKEGDSEDQESSKLDNDKEIEREGPYLITSDLDWLYMYLQKRRKEDKRVPYLHELLEGSDIELPKNEIIKRNPVLEARCVKLRAQQEAREYRKMTRGVDNVRIRFPDDSISYQLKQINRQLIAIGQFILSIFAGFLFGFKGVEWMVGPLDFGFKLLLGVMCALIIALAEIYFLAKKLNEELSVPETVQLGGPPKFVDTKNYTFEPSKPINDKKEHQE